ncbi:MAG: hypothetical protein ACFFAH_16560 [Promethearchaeota archaeon]
MFSLIIVIIFIIVGLLTALKYREIKNKTYIWWGIGLLGQGLVWLGSGISFLMIIIFGVGLGLQTYFLLSFSWAAITLMFWMWTITELMAKGKQKIILGIYAVIGLLFEIYYFFTLFTAEAKLGEISSPSIDSRSIGLLQLYLIFVLASIAISLFWFIGKSWKSEDREVRLKAKFLLIAMIMFVFGAFLDGFISLTTAPIFIVRIILVASAILFYLGWNLPEVIKKIFIK